MSEPAAPTNAPEAPQPAAPVTPAGSPDGDKGFPEGTALAEMTDAQKAAYWQHYSRKHEDTVKAFNGLTPQQVKDLQAKVDALEAEKLSAGEKELKQARDDAAKAAAEAARAEYLPQIQALQVKSIASQIISGDKLAAFMSIANPAALVGEDGQVDETRVMGTLTAMYGADPQPGQRQPQWQNFGQYTPPPPAQKAGAGGAAEAAKRFGKKT
jgi:hypothetical protein